jgi:SpoVK/Ycf46/Vps4 family AAA+-type ATPase
MQLLGGLLGHDHAISDELKMSVAVRYGQRPSNIVAIARQYWKEHPIKEGEAPYQLTSRDIDRYMQDIAQMSSVHAFSSSRPKVSWDDIGGLASVKQSLMEMVVWPLEKPHVFIRMGISPPLGMLLHGPPGTGKTMLAKAAACASGCNFLTISASDLMKAEIGESEKAITRAFDTARALSPCMVFIDEFQSLFGNRSTAGAVSGK